MADNMIIEPVWSGLRRWALAGLKAETDPKTRKALESVLKECEIAKAAGRPDTDWES